MASADKIKVLVLGDSGVGKSSLVHLICHSKPMTSSSWTIGCSVDVKWHEYKEGTPSHKSCFIELWDVGGSRSHAIARNVFYNSFHGIILVHDLTNRKSHLNLRKWCGEVFAKESVCKENSSLGALFPIGTNDEFSFDAESFFERNIPVLVVATKLDLADSPTRRSRGSSIAEECAAEEIFLSCHQAKSFAAGSTNAVKLSRFFDKVADKKFQTQNAFPQFLDRNKRLSANPVKFSHLD